MKAFYNKLGEKKFKTLCIGLFLVGDLMICAYFYQKFSDWEQFQAAVKLSIQLAGPKAQLGSLPKNFYREAFELVQRTLQVCFAFYLLVHSGFYLAYAYQRVFAYKYLKVISLLGVIGSIYFMALNHKNIWGVFFLLQGFFFLFNHLGLKKFKVLAKNLEQ